MKLTLQGRLLQLEIDEPQRQQGLLLAGCYVLETDVAASCLDAQAVHDGYRDLAQVEKDFRTLKTGLLEIRPVFVRKESRTRGHVFACMLALKISRQMQQRLSAQFGTTDDQPHGLTLSDAFDSLNRLTLDLYPVEDQLMIPMLPRPDHHQTRILEALKVYLPSKFAKKPRVPRR